MMFLYNVLIKLSMKFIATQRELRVITFEYYDSRRPPWKSVAPVQFSLSLSQSYNPHKRSYLSSRAVEKSYSNKGPWRFWKIVSLNHGLPVHHF